MGKHKDPELTAETGQAGSADDREPRGEERAAATQGHEAGNDKASPKDTAEHDANGGEAGDQGAPQQGDDAAPVNKEDAAGHPDEPLGHAEEPADGYRDEAMSDFADQVAEERSHRTVYATMFYGLLAIIAVAGLTLWAAPKIAPHVPKVIGQYLVPGQVGAAKRIKALEHRLSKQASQTEGTISALRQRINDLSSKVDAKASSQKTQAALDDIRKTAKSAASDASALSQRVDKIQSQIADLRKEVNSISNTLSGANGSSPPQLSAAIASLRSRLDQLAGTVQGGPKNAELAKRLDEMSKKIDDLKGNLAAAREAGNKASSAIRATRLQSAFDTLSGRLAGGQPYAAALSEIASLSGTKAPEALAGAANDGLASASELEASFGRYAQAAIAAQIRAASGNSTLGKALGWVRSQVAGRPIEEESGNSVPAITSRIAARLGEGRLDAALGEAESLPAPARKALDGWLDRLRARVAADKALAKWRDQITAKG